MWQDFDFDGDYADSVFIEDRLNPIYDLKEALNREHLKVIFWKRATIILAIAVLVREIMVIL